MNPFLNLKNQCLILANQTNEGMIVLEFEDYILTIYNRYSLVNCSDVLELTNIKVTKINIFDGDIFELIFDNEMKFIVYIDDNSYNSPEAMQLLGPNNLIAVWQ